MATGFNCGASHRSGGFAASRRGWRHFIASLVLIGQCSAAFAVQVGLAGIVGNKAVLMIDGTATRTLSPGQRTDEGVKLVAVDGAAATIEVDGVRKVLRLGQNASGAPSGADTVVLDADARGHVVTTGIVNGLPVRFLVDTGASMVALGSGDAKRLGLQVGSGERSLTQTANGVVEVRRVRLDNVRIGSISVNGVDAAVHDNDMPIALLGMSFLGRMEMRNENGRMTLRKRY